MFLMESRLRYREKILQKAFEESILSRTPAFVCDLHKAFCEYREVIEHSPYASRPSTSINDDNNEKGKETVLENRQVGIKKIVEDLNISYISNQPFSFLSMKLVNARLAPKHLNLLQKPRRAEGPTFFKRIIRGGFMNMTTME